MEGPYREGEDRIGAEERESLAVERFGRWQSTLRTRVVLVFVVAGVVLGIAGYFVAEEAQLRLMGVAWAWLSAAAGFGVPLALLGLLGAFVARKLVASRAPAVVSRIAAECHIPPGRLDEIAKLSTSL